MYKLRNILPYQVIFSGLHRVTDHKDWMFIIKQIEGLNVDETKLNDQMCISWKYITFLSHHLWYDQKLAKGHEHIF